MLLEALNLTCATAWLWFVSVFH